MGELTDVERDVARMAEYWGERKMGWREEAAAEFERAVRPLAFFEEPPARDRIDAVNMCFTPGSPSGAPPLFPPRRRRPHRRALGSTCAGTTSAGEDSMGELTDVERDVARMAEYWGERKMGWREEAAAEFERAVRPLAFFEEPPARDRIDAVNMCFTEWALFERPLRRGRTPLQLYVEAASEDAREVSLCRLRQVEQTQFFSRFAILGKDLDRGIALLRDVRTGGEYDVLDPFLSLCRLRQVEQTQFFSRFAILGKDLDRGIALLRDVRTGGEYDVLDPFLCSRDRWSAGTIAERVACVDGVWQVVGQARLYDHATPDETAHDGPGELHPEDADDAVLRDASFFLRLVRDVMGLDGRYAQTLSLRKPAHDGPGELHPEDADDAVLRDASFFLRLVRDVMGLDGRYAQTLSLRKPSPPRRRAGRG